MKRAYLLLVVLFALSLGTVRAQSVAVKTNALYWATTTPNIGLEFAMGKKFTFGSSIGYNPFEFNGRYTDEGLRINTKAKHWMVSPELKYWFCRSFQRGYLGLHGVYSDFNIGGIPYIGSLENVRYKGRLYGGGLTYGYHWALGNQCGLEFSLGVGYLKIDYDKYECFECGEYFGKYTTDYIGLTKAELSFVYFIR